MTRRLRVSALQRRLPDALWLVGFAVPLWFFGFLVARYAVNVPMHDEYDMVLRFMNSFLQAGSIGERANLLWQQQVESRVIVLKLQALLQYALFGAIDFRGLLLVGNLVRVLFAGALTYQGWRQGLGKFQLLAIPYILLAPVSSDNLYSVNGQVHIWNVLFGLLFVVALTWDRIWAACILYVMGIYALAGGLVLYPLGLGFLALKRRWKGLAIYGVTATLFTVLYFYRYYGSALSSRFRLLDPAQVIKAFFAFMGAGLYAYDIALVVGVALAAALACMAVLAAGRDDFVVLAVSWLLASGALVAAGRASMELGVGSLPARYAVYSQIAMVLIVVWGLKLLPPLQAGGRLPVLVALISIVYFSFALVANWGGRRFQHEEDYKIAGINTLAAYHDPELLVYPRPTNAADILAAAQRLGVYDYSAVGAALRQPVQWVDALPTPNAGLEAHIDKNAGGYLAGWAFIPQLSSGDSRISVLLREATRAADLATFVVSRPDVAIAFPEADHTFAGFECFVSAYDLPPGTYDVGILVRNGSQVAIRDKLGTLTLP